MYVCMSHLWTMRTTKYDWQAIQVLHTLHTSHVWTVRMIKYDIKQASNVCREPDEVSEERLRWRREKDLEEKLMKKDKQCL